MIYFCKKCTWAYDNVLVCPECGRPTISAAEELKGLKSFEVDPLQKEYLEQRHRERVEKALTKSKIGFIFGW